MKKSVTELLINKRKKLICPGMLIIGEYGSGKTLCIKEDIKYILDTLNYEPIYIMSNEIAYLKEYKEVEIEGRVFFKSLKFIIEFLNNDNDNQIRKWFFIDLNNTVLDENDEYLLSAFIRRARKYNVKFLISINDITSINYEFLQNLYWISSIIKIFKLHTSLKTFQNLEYIFHDFPNKKIQSIYNTIISQKTSEYILMIKGIDDKNSIVLKHTVP